MATRYSQHVSTKSTPQTQPIPGSAQVANSAGGYSFAVDRWTQLDRFLILGAEGGTYYISEQKLVQDNAKSVIECIKEDGVRAVNRIIEISDAGRASKNDPAIFALALATAYGNDAAKRLAYDSLNKVCRIPTHLFHFAQYVDDLRGWGSGLKKAVARWYSNQDADKLAYSIVKYQQRDGWSHRDLLRLSHPERTSPAHDALFRYAAVGIRGLGKRSIERNRGGVSTTKNYADVSAHLPPLIVDFEALNDKSTLKDVLPLIEKYNLPHEAVPTHLKSDPQLWEALLAKGMPVTALLRNLANMTRIGTLAPLNQSLKTVVATLTNEEALKKARVHPVAILNALKTYSSGHSSKGSNTWTPIQQVVDALDKAFYASFKFVQPTGKSILLALDVSASMTWHKCAGADGLTPREGSAAMSLVTANIEQNYHIMAFSAGLVPINISPRMRLDDVLNNINRTPAGGTDCSLPMEWAIETKTVVDEFVVYTDNETYAGRRHPSQALQDYRRKVNPAAKLVVVAMEGNKFTIADPNDAGMLDCVGFDTNTPEIIANFVRD